MTHRNKAMKVIVMLALACSMSAMAQMNTASDSSPKQGQNPGRNMSMTGCIAEKDGNYMMMNKEHPDGVMLMSLEDLKPHVGHEVKVSGMMDKMSAMPEDSARSDTTMSSEERMKHDQMMGMKVTSMKMMSEHCDMSKMMNK